jgi:hypothetical protein
MRASLFLVALVTAFGCGGSMPVPQSQLTQSKASIRAAEEVGAPRVPQAALHLKMAQDQVAQAEKLIADDDNEEATLVLARAEADAELALELAREASLKAQAQEALNKVDKLKSESK